MKYFTRILGICFASAVLVGTTSGQGLTFLTNGLVAYYPFTGNANDASGNGNDGIVSGAVLTNDRFGVPSHAYSFSSFGDKITTANANGFPLSTNDFTISFWVNVPSENGLHQIFLCNGASEQFQIHIGPLSSQTQIAFATGGDGAGGCVSPSIEWLLNRWYNVQVVRFQNTINIYRDGVLLASNFTAVGNDAPPMQQGIIFGYRPSPANQFNGMLDDIRIYNRALSPSELQQLYAYETVPTISLIKAVKPKFDNLFVGANYQLQVSGDLTNWTNQGSAFAATNTSMEYPQYFNVDNWDSLFFRTQIVP